MKLFAFIVIGAFALASAKSIEEPSSIEEDLLTVDVSAVLVEGTQCLVDAVAKVSHENGLTELWDEKHSVIKGHLSKWAKCSSAGNKLAQVICNVKEGLAVYKPITEYLQLVAVQNPLVIQSIALEYYNRCAPGSAPFDHLLLDSANM